MDAPDGFSGPRLARLDAGMQRFVDEGKFAGILSLVWRRGEVAHVHKAGWMDLAARAPMRRDAIFRIYSMTKPIVSAAVMMLVEEGRLRLQDPVARWLPEAEQIVLEGCGHVPQVEMPARTNGLLTRFFARVDCLGRPGRHLRVVDAA